MQDIILFLQHHMLLSGAFAIILIILIFLEFIKIKQGATQLTPAAATQLINRQKATVIDIRSYDAYLAGHIVGAISLPLSELSTKLKKIEKYKSDPIIVVCANGIESKQAAQLLLKNGYQPHILRGGLNTWREADLPLIKG